MPVFETPGPVSLRLELLAADVDITSGDRTDTRVVIRPAGDGEAAARAAQETVVEHRDGTVLVRAPRQRRGWFAWNRSSEGDRDAAIHVTVELPAGSDVTGEAALGHLTARGRLGAFHYTSTCGSVRVEETGRLHVEAALGDVSVGTVDGDAELALTQGHLKIGLVRGSAVVKNLSGASELGEAVGDVRITAANGDITIDLAHAGVEAKNVNGDIVVGEVVNGDITLETTRGSLGVGVREGTAAHLDARSLVGGVNNKLTPSAAPSASDNSVRLRTRTVMGEITVHRA
jgi:hypothetical protein